MDDREFYEALVPLARQELGSLRDAEEAELARLEFEAVDLAEDAKNGLHIAALFRDPERPECRFGWRWSWAEGPLPDEVEFAAGVLAVNLEEDILSDRYGLPADCVAEGVTWF